MCTNEAAPQLVGNVALLHASILPNNEREGEEEKDVGEGHCASVQATH
jgi:hypothetical protein